MASKTKKERKVRRKSTGAELVKLDAPGKSVEGWLRDMVVKDLFSPKTKVASPTRMYTFELEDDAGNPSGKRVLITGAHMVDDQFDEISVAENGHTVEEGLGKLRDQFFRIERGEDKRTNAGNTLGSYEVTMYD